MNTHGCTLLCFALRFCDRSTIARERKRERERERQLRVFHCIAGANGTDAKSILPKKKKILKKKKRRESHEEAADDQREEREQSTRERLAPGAEPPEREVTGRK